MTDKINLDWIENYGFILIAFAHMTDWFLADAEIEVTNKKIRFMLSQTNQDFSEEEVAEKLNKILHRYESVKERNGDEMMESLITACESIKKEIWFNKMSATTMVNSLAEIAESDHRIEKTEIQLLKNISGIFGVNSPRI